MMENSLMKINALLVEWIEADESAVSELKRLSVRLEQEVEHLATDQRMHYLIFLAEIYATKLINLPKAYHLLDKVSQDLDETITLQYLLRLSYFNYLDSKYKDAIQILKNAFKMCEQSSSLFNIAKIFCQRILGKANQQAKLQHNLLDKLYLEAIELERNRQFEEAIQLQIKIYKQFGQSDQVKYEAAKHLSMLKHKSNIYKKQANLNEDEYQQTIQFYELTHSAQYYSIKVSYLIQIMDFLDSCLQGQEEHRDTQSVQIFLMILKLRKARFAVGDEEVKKTFSNAILNLTKSKPQSIQSLSCSKHIQREYFIFQNMEKKVKLFLNRILFQCIQKYQSKIDNFEGSKMTKINLNSEGYEERYFYIKKNFSKTFKLFYCSKKQKQSDEDNYYLLKNFKSVKIGKSTDALQRKECSEFEEEQCFSILLKDEDNRERNFYVKKIEDFEEWMNLLSKFLTKKKQKMSQIPIEKSMAKSKFKKDQIVFE